METQRELERIRQIKEMIVLAQSDSALQSRLLSNSQEFLSIVNELGQKEISLNSAVDQVTKTTSSINAAAEAFVFERFGFKGVNLDNLEQVYNPLRSGNSSLHETRTHLL